MKKQYRIKDEKQILIDQLLAMGINVTATNGKIDKLEFDPGSINKGDIELLIGDELEEIK